MHTEEKLKATLWAEGEYQQDGLAEINYLLHDHRSGKHTDMYPQLVNLLFLLHEKARSKQTFHSVSGSHIPASIEMLRKSSTGVDQKSLHTHGMTVDL